MDYPIRFPDQLKPYLRALRKSKGFTQAQLGKLLNVRQVRIAEIESDPSAISVAQLFRLLAALDAHLVLSDTRGDNSSDGRTPEGPSKGAW